MILVTSEKQDIARAELHYYQRNLRFAGPSWTEPIVNEAYRVDYRSWREGGGNLPLFGVS